MFYLFHNAAAFAVVLRTEGDQEQDVNELQDGGQRLSDKGLDVNNFANDVNGLKDSFSAWIRDLEKKLPR